MSNIDSLKAAVAELKAEGGFGEEGIYKDGIQVIDGDTIKDEEGTIRLSGIDTSETPHLNPYTLDYAPGGEIKGILQTGETANLIGQGFNQPYRSGEQGYFGRDLGDLSKEDGTSLTKTLLSQGLADPSLYATQDELAINNIGALDRAQRKATSQMNEADKRRSVLLEAASLTIGGNPFLLKDTAATEAYYAAAPNMFRGVAMQRSDRTIMNETKGWQIDDAFAMGKTNGKIGGYAFTQLVGDLVGLDGLSDFGEANAARLKREMQDLPQLRDMEAFDENGEWTLDGISEFSNYVFSNAAASAPLMGVTIASLYAAPFTWGTSLAIPAAMYSGMTYDAQNTKDVGKALTSGTFQAALDIIGVRGVNPMKLFTSAGRKSAITKIAAQKKISEEAAEALLSQAIKDQTGNFLSTTGRALSKSAKVGKNIGKGALYEGITETTQEAIALWGEGNLVTPQEVKNRMLNAIVAGGTLGAGFTSVAELSSGIKSSNITKGNQLADKTAAQLTNSQDMEDFGKVLDVNEAIDKIKTTKISVEEVKDEPVVKKVKPYRNPNDGFDEFRIKAEEQVISTNGVISHRVDARVKALKENVGPEAATAYAMAAQAKSDEMIADRANKNKAAAKKLKVKRSTVVTNENDATEGMSLKEQAAARSKEKEDKALLDNVGDAVPYLWQASLENKLKAYKTGKYGSMLWSLLVGKNGRAGRNFEEARRQNSADIVSNKYLDPVEGPSNLGFQNTRELSNSVEASKEAITRILRQARTVEDVRVIAAKENIDSRLLPFITAIFEKNLAIRADTGIKEANLLEKTFNKSYIYRNQKKFIAMLQTELGVSAEVAIDITQAIIKNEDYTNPDDALSGLLNLSSAPDKGAVKKYAQYKDVFNEYLMSNIMDNVQANAVKFGNVKANIDYIGENGSIISKGLDLMKANNEVDSEEKAKLAYELDKFLQQISGEYHRVDNRMYNTAVNNVSLLSMVSMLPMAAISSLTESALVIFSSPRPLYAAWKMSQFTAKEFVAIANEGLTALSNGRIPMKDYFHREMLRKSGYLLETQGAAARLGVDSSPSQARFVQSFFKVNGLTSLTNIQRVTALVMAEDAVNHWVDQAVLQKGVNNRLYTEAYDNLSFLGVNPEIMIEHKESYHGLNDSLNSVIGSLSMADREKLYLEQMEVAKTRFVDQRVIQPFKGNRPEFYSDPRFRLFTMFQGFISTFTANVLPMLYGQAFSKNSLPEARVKAITTMAAMIAFTYFAQNLKDALKGKDEDDDLPPFKEFLRTLYGSGLVGTVERPLTAIMPLYGNNSDTGKLIEAMLGPTAGAVTDSVIGESPQLSYVDNFVGIFSDAMGDDQSRIPRDLLKATPANVFKNWLAPMEKE